MILSTRTKSYKLYGDAIMTRTKNTFFNVSSGIVTMLVTNILGFFSRTLFIHYLDVSYLGINGLYSNILSMLSLAELGIGTSIAYSLYKPLAEKNYEKISSLMTFYRKAYTCIGTFIGVAGLLIMFFFPVVIPEIMSVENYKIYYLLFLFNTVTSYFLAYKETLISADQKNYQLTAYNLVFQISATVLQMLIVVLSRKYIGYLIVQILVATVRKIMINRYITKAYPEINFSSKEKISPDDFAVLKKNVAGMLMNKIGAYIVYGTDNILIASFANIGTVGLYSNYSMIVNIVYSTMNILFNSMTHSVGNLAASESKETEYRLFKSTYFLTFCIAGFTSVCLYSLLNPFVSLWLGENYTLKQSIVFVIVLNYYLTVMRRGSEIYYSGNGLYWYGRYKAFVESIINLIASIALASSYGLIGIFLGTTVSSICTSVFYDSYTLYKYGFQQEEKFLSDYVARYFVYLAITLLCGNMIIYVERLIGNKSFISMLFILAVAAFVFCSTVFVLFGVIRKSDEICDILKRGIGFIRLRQDIEKKHFDRQKEM